jgi:3-deoxy-D-manno-octulosonate 8-phosphate phosphatase (KDO 8-P phosphatase)
VTRIRAVALDVDGVLTDGTFLWGPEGEEFKRFSFRDVMGVSLARKSGIVFALISGEASPLVDRFAQKMGIAAVYKGCKDKGAALREFAGTHGIPLEEVCFVGDDVNDLPAFADGGAGREPRRMPTPGRKLRPPMWHRPAAGMARCGKSLTT